MKIDDKDSKVRWNAAAPKFQLLTRNKLDYRDGVHLYRNLRMFKKLKKK